MNNVPNALRLAAASLLLLTACAGAQQAAPVADNTTVGLWRQIQAANTNRACDNDSQCHTIGVGAKACGGPENYIAWSSKDDNGAKLKSLVELHSAARRADNNSQGVMSTCMAVSDPGATCRAGICTLNTRDSVPPSDK